MYINDFPSPLSPLTTPGGPSTIESEGADVVNVTPDFMKQFEELDASHVARFELKREYSIDASVEASPKGKLIMSVKYLKKNGKKPATSPNGEIIRHPTKDSEQKKDDDE